MERSSLADTPSEAPAGPRAWRYQPALDGLRGLAVLGVLLYHGGASWMQGGFLGVDAFFVLSGFLITSLLVVELAQRGRIDLRAFWARRARRLLPALLLLVVAVAIFALAMAGTREAGRIRADGIATLLYGSNWWFIASGTSYFEQFLAPSPLKHTWSLAIEEQFYFVWPLVFPLLVTWTRRRPRLLAPLLGVMAAASAVLMAVLFEPGRDPSRVYFGTDTRAQSILVGAALAVMCAHARREPSATERRVIDGLGVVALVALGGAWAFVGDNDERPYRFGFLLAAVLVATVIAAAVQPNGVVRTVLSVRPLRAVGIISYGLYLWHWPIYVWCNPERTGLDGPPLLVLRLAITAVVSVASYFLVESPIRHQRIRVAWPAMRRAAVPAAIGFTLLALLLATSALISRTSRDRSGASAVALVSANRTASQEAAQNAIAAQPSAVRAMLVGDSVAATLGVTYSATDAGTPLLAVNTVAEIGCGVVEGTLWSDGEYRRTAPWCGRWPARWDYGREVLRPQVSVLLTGAWELFTREVDGQRLEFGSPEFEYYMRARLDAGIDILTARGAPVLVLTVPCFGELRDALFPWGSERADPERVAWLNALLRKIAAARPTQVRVIDLNGYLCPREQWDGALGGTPMLADQVHFSDAGGRAVWKWLAPQVEAVARSGV